MKRVKVGVHRLRQHQRGLSEGVEDLSDPRSGRAVRHEPRASAARAAEFGIPARSVEETLADPEIEIILNLTVPKAHVEVGLRAIAAGKHVHSEKPLGVTVAEARILSAAAKAGVCGWAARRTRS